MKKLTKGLRTDERYIDQPDGTWRDARNIVFKYGSIKNEKGLDDITPSSIFATSNFPTTKVIGIISTNTRKVFFFGSTSASDSEIGIVEANGTYNRVIKDALLNFHEDHPIQGVFEYKFNNNLIVAWTDSTNGKWNENRILNIDCPAFEISGGTTIVETDKFKALIKLFPSLLTPTVDDLYVIENGGALKTGVYYPILSYRLKDGTTTGWFSKFNPVPIVLDNSNLTFNQYDGDISDITTSKRLHINLVNVDTNYDFLKFGVVYQNNGVRTAYYVSEFKINGASLELDFSGAESIMEIIALEEVLVPNETYPYSKTITTSLNKLLLGNSIKNDFIEYQSYANDIVVKWKVEQDIDFTDNLSTSYKNSSTVFFNKSFRSDEVYALYIAFKLKDGTYTDAYHIPGRDILPNEDDVVSNTETEYLKIGGVKKFQVYDTALADGTMGYWENATEVYPNNSIDFPTLQGLPIRHHKFPSLRSLKKWGKNFIFKPEKITGGGAQTTHTSISSAFSSSPPNALQFDAEYTVGTNTLPFSHSGGSGGVALSFNPTANVAAFFKYNINVNIQNLVTTTNPNLTAVVSIFIGTIADVYPSPYSGDTTNTIVNIQNSYTFADTSGTGNLSLNFNLTDILLQLSSASPDEIDIVVKVEFINYNTPQTPAPVANFTGSTFDMDLVILTPKTRRLGIEVSNVNIPSNILDRVDSWEIFYAKRNNANISIIGQDIGREDRFHQFDLLNTQASLRADYVKYLLDYNKPDGSSTKDTTSTVYEGFFHEYANEIATIKNFFYIGENVLIPIDNTNLSSSVYIETYTYGIPVASSNFYSLIDFCIYREDMYKSYFTQDLISTGVKNKITASGVQSLRETYGGDIFINSYGFIENATSFNEYLELVESVSNIGLRNDDLIGGKYYYPKHISSDTLKPTLSYYGYNSDYSALNDLEKVFPYNSPNDGDCVQFITDFPQRISLSIDDADESTNLGWRIFKANSYYDMPKNKGVIWNLLGNDRILYIQHEYTLYRASIADRLGTNDGEIYLGISDLFSRPPIEMLPIKEGSCGSTSQFSCVVNKLGYFNIDRVKGKVYMLPLGDDTQLIELSKVNGMFEYFLKNGQQQSPTIDNPFNNQGYTICYDGSNNRILITKKDIVGSTDKSFTISYTPDCDSGFLAFHDYAANYMFNTREAVFLIDNNGASGHKLYKHNSSTKKAKFFGGTLFRSYIDVVFNEKGDVTKTFSNVSWLSEVVDSNGVKLEAKTITHLVMYNTNQCSGLLNLQADKGVWFGRDPRNNEETWQFNHFRDMIKDKNTAFLDSNNQLISGNIATQKAWFEKSKFITKLAIVRFQYDNVDQNDLYIIAVDTNTRDSNR